MGTESSGISSATQRGAFTPKQLGVLLWRLDKHGIPYKKSYLKMVIRRDREKAQLLSMADWKIRKLWPCMSESQRKFYVTNTGRTP